MKILVIHGNSQYDALPLFATALGEGFRSLGHEADVSHLCNINDIFNKSLSIQEGKTYSDIDVLINLNGVANENEAFGNILNRFKMRLFTLFVDHPIHQSARVNTNIERHQMSFVCESQLSALEFLTGKKKSNAYFLPHGGVSSRTHELTLDEFRKRKNNILFIGSFYGIPAEKPWLKLNNKRHHILCEHMLNQLNDGISFEKSFVEFLKKKTVTELSPLYKQILPLVDGYARKTVRYKTIMTLLEQGCHVDCYGNGDWPSFPQHPNFNYLGSIDMASSLDILSQYQFVLNDCNFFPNGSHERIFNTMLQGAVSISYKSSFYEKAFNENEAVFITEKSLVESSARIKMLQNNPDIAFEIANAGFNAAIKNHTWQHRAAQIVDIINQG